MKKFCYLIMMLLLSIVMISCGKDKENDNGDIILGNEVDSVTIKVNENELTFTKDSDFYDVFNLVYLDFKNRKISFHFEEQMENQDKSISSGSLYFTSDYSFFISEVHLEGSSDVASIKEYDYHKNEIINNDVHMIYNYYNSYSYLEEKAFGGQEIDTKNDVDITYSSSMYPMVPPLAYAPEKLLGSLQAHSKRVEEIIQKECPNIYKPSNEFKVGDKTYDLTSYVSESFKLYENYIVFEQISPFAFDYRKMICPEDLKHIPIRKSITSCSVKHTMIYDIKKNEVVSYSVVGNALSLFMNPNTMIDINLTFNFFEINENELNESLTSLKDYIYENCDIINVR